MYGSELSDTGVTATNAYGWGVNFKKKSVQSLLVKYIGLTHLGSRIRNRILTKILSRENYSNKTLFDAGCGIGLESVHLSSQFKNVVGADIERKKIKEAEKLAKENSVNNAKFIQADLTKNTLKKPHSFDLVISLEVIEHVSSDKKFIDGLSRLLNKNGKIIISFPAKTLLSRIARKSLDHFKVGYNIDDFEELLNGTDLKIVHVYSFGKSILGKIIIAIDFLFKKTFPVLSILFFHFFLSIINLRSKSSWFWYSEGISTNT